MAHAAKKQRQASAVLQSLSIMPGGPEDVTMVGGEEGSMLSLMANNMYKQAGLK